MSDNQATDDQSGAEQFDEDVTGLDDPITSDEVATAEYPPDHLEGVPFGSVSHLFETPANDVLVVQGERQRLIPFLMGRHIESVDFDARKIVVDWDADF